MLFGRRQRGKSSRRKEVRGAILPPMQCSIRISIRLARRVVACLASLLVASHVEGATAWSQQEPARSTAVRTKPRPNILFIFTDDHAPHAIGAYGGRLKSLNPTPNIDRLAASGMLFQNSFCSNSICGPSRAVILTGKHSHRNGFDESL